MKKKEVTAETENNWIIAKNSSLSKYNKRKTAELTFLALPALLMIFILRYLPIGGLVMAFQDFRFDTGFFNSKFVGFDNFKFLFSSEDFIRITVNSLAYNLVFILTGTIGSLIIALLLFEVKSKIAIKVYQTAILLPYFLSMVIVSYVVYGFLSVDLGILNTVLGKMGIEPVLWYSEKKYWPFILILVNFWKGFGYTAIVYYAALIGIDSTYFEAASMEGASKFQITTKICIPLVMPIVIIMILMSIGRIFYSDFALFYVVPKNSGVLYPVTDVIDTYIYRSLKNLDNLGMASAVGFYQSAVGCVLVLITNWVVKKAKLSNGLF